MNFFAIVIPAATFLVWPAISHAQKTPSYCQNSAHADARPAPSELTSAIATAFQVDPDAVKDGSYVRCVGPMLLACYVGANLNCGKADQRRVLPGASSWCRQNPGSKFIPMVETGHDTIYDWSCKGRRAIAGKPVLTVDPQGYVGENWRKIP